MCYGAFGNDIGVRVGINSGDIIIQETIDYTDEIIMVVAEDIIDSSNSVMISPEVNTIIESEKDNFSKFGMNKAPEYLVFNQLPIGSKLVVMVYLTVMLFMVVFSIWFFKNFMQSINHGNYFQKETIINLRRLSYLLLGVWGVNFIYEIIISSLWSVQVSSGLLDDWSVIVDVPSISVLIFALILWVISHVFIYGAELKEENNLTI